MSGSWASMRSRALRAAAISSASRTPWNGMSTHSIGRACPTGRTRRTGSWAAPRTRRSGRPIFGSRRSRNMRSPRWTPRFAMRSTPMLRSAVPTSAAASPKVSRDLPRPVHRQLAVRAPRIELGQFRLIIAPGADQRLEVRHGQGLAVVKALALIAPQRLQKLELLGRFDAFRHHFQFQAMSERDDRAHDGGILGSRHDLADESPVDLQLVDRKSPQIAHAGVAGAEGVDRYQYAHRTQFLENGDRLFRIAHHRAFGEFHLEIARFESGQV